MLPAEGASEEISQLHSQLVAQANQLVHENNKILQKPLSECFENPTSNHAAAVALKASGILEKLADINTKLEALENNYPELKKVSLAGKFYDARGVP